MGIKTSRWAMPDAYIIIFGIVLLAAVATYLIPAGSYTREVVEGINKVVPGSYQRVEQNPASLMAIFYAIPLGLKQTASIIFLILIVGGTVAIYDHTKSIEAGINHLIIKAKGRYVVLITTVAIIFGLLSALGLSGNAVIAFIPIGIALSRSLKLDAITGVAIVYLSYYGASASALFEPTILGTAQTLAEVPLFSGILFRFVLLIVIMAVTIMYIIWYAKRISLFPHKSFMQGVAVEEIAEPVVVVDHTFNHRQKFSLLLFLVFISIFLYGAMTLKWGLDHLSGLFIMLSVIVGALFKIGANNYIKVFMTGAQSLVYGACVVGLARAVIVVLNDGQVLDSIIEATLIPLQQASHYWAAQLLYVFNLLFNLLVTSGTGQATIVMPIMVPMLDALDLTRQTGVLIFKLGDGFTNVITPTSGVLMAVLAVGKVPWTRWVKFVFPIMMIWIMIGMVAVWIATAINYGPI